MELDGQDIGERLIGLVFQGMVTKKDIASFGLSQEDAHVSNKRSKKVKKATG